MANKYTAFRYVDDTHKECSWCSLIKPHSDFNKDKRNIYARGLAYYCKDCASAKTRAHHAKYKHTQEYQNRKRSSYFKRNYNLSLEERTKLLQAQNYKCAICAFTIETVGNNTHTDHCHNTGKVRGILCTNCNRGLGHFQESTENLMAAIEYLKAHMENGNPSQDNCP